MVSLSLDILEILIPSPRHVRMNSTILARSLMVKWHDYNTGSLVSKSYALYVLYTAAFTNHATDVTSPVEHLSGVGFVPDGPVNANPGIGRKRWPDRYSPP